MTDIQVRRGTTLRYRWEVTHPETGSPVDVTDGDYLILGHVRPIAEGDLLFSWDSAAVDGGITFGNGFVEIELTEDQSREIAPAYDRVVYQILMRKISTDEVVEIDSGKLLLEDAIVEW